MHKFTTAQSIPGTVLAPLLGQGALADLSLHGGQAHGLEGLPAPSDWPCLPPTTSPVPSSSPAPALVLLDGRNEAATALHSGGSVVPPESLHASLLTRRPQWSWLVKSCPDVGQSLPCLSYAASDRALGTSGSAQDCTLNDTRASIQMRVRSKHQDASASHESFFPSFLSQTWILEPISRGYPEHTVPRQAALLQGLVECLPSLLRACFPVQMANLCCFHPPSDCYRTSFHPYR